MRGRTMIFAALVLLAALGALIYGAVDGPPGKNQTADPGRLDSEATRQSTNAGGRDRLPPNVRNESPAERRGNGTGGNATTGSAGQMVDPARPGVGTVPQTERR
jgi:hypothetical protein